MTTSPSRQVYWGRATRTIACVQPRPRTGPTSIYSLRDKGRLPSFNGYGRLPPPRPQVLKVRKIDPCISENGREHRTDRYCLMRTNNDPQLIVRRGQQFFLLIILERNYSPQDDGISFVFQLEGVKMPNLGSKTEIVVPLRNKGEDETSNQWSAALVQQGEKNIYVSIHPSSTCLVGEWKLQVDTKLHNESMGTTFQYRKAIIILFNPWCKSDSVYLSCEPERKEYVLNEKGILFRGCHKSISPKFWYFGQFQLNIVKCALMLFSEVSPVQPAYRHDPIRITRSLSAALNSEDDNGVLVVWRGGDYNGTDPECWAGSFSILTKYYKSKQPIKYGQSWVFAGVCTTVCRALGIPCRPVTVYRCAHDNDGNLLVDVYMDEKCQQMKTGDEVWEYHVLNEVWMKRPDLSSEYDGWNVIDAMPIKQSHSTNIYQCGPASVKAIKNGEILKAHDTHYLYASVNADIVYWKFTGEDRPLKLIKTETDNIGCKIVTKFYENDCPVDLTENYKFEAGSAEERGIMERALQECGNSISRIYMNTQFKKVIIKISVSDESPMIGSPFEALVTIRNTDQQNSYKVDAIVGMELVSNTCSNMDYLKFEHFVTHIAPQQEYQYSMKVTYDDYKYCNLKEEEYFRVCYGFFIDCVDFDYVDFIIVQLRKPVLNIMIRELTKQDKILWGPPSRSTADGAVQGSQPDAQFWPPTYGGLSQDPQMNTEFWPPKVDMPASTQNNNRYMQVQQQQQLNQQGYQPAIQRQQQHDQPKPQPPRQQQQWEQQEVQSPREQQQQWVQQEEQFHSQRLQQWEQQEGQLPSQRQQQREQQELQPPGQRQQQWAQQEVQSPREQQQQQWVQQEEQLPSQRQQQREQQELQPPGQRQQQWAQQEVQSRREQQQQQQQWVQHEEHPPRQRQQQLIQQNEQSPGQRQVQWEQQEEQFHNQRLQQWEEQEGQLFRQRQQQREQQEFQPPGQRQQRLEQEEQPPGQRQQQWEQQKEQSSREQQQQEEQSPRERQQQREHQEPLQPPDQRQQQWDQQYQHHQQQQWNQQYQHHYQQQQWEQQELQPASTGQQQWEQQEPQFTRPRQEQWDQQQPQSLIQQEQPHQQQSRTHESQQLAGSQQAQLTSDQQHQLSHVPRGLIFEVVATLSNPLPVKLTNNCFRFEGAENLNKTKADRDIPPNTTISVSCQWKLMDPGKYSVTGTFTSNELEGVTGSCEFIVT